MDRIRTHLTYANVVATLAAFGVLTGGSAYAAATIGSGSIKRDAVRAKHIKDGAVTAAKLAADARALIGPAGPAGAPGPAGAAGRPGASPKLGPIITSEGSPVTVGPAGTKFSFAICPQGTRVITGGYVTTGRGLVAGGIRLKENGWAVVFDNLTSGTLTGTATAYCLAE